MPHTSHHTDSFDSPSTPPDANGARLPERIQSGSPYCRNTVSIAGRTSAVCVAGSASMPKIIRVALSAMVSG